MQNCQRLTYLDNLRSIIIIFMVIGHGAAAYKIDGGNLWLMPDPSNSYFYNMLSEFGLSFRMPVLFFLSGFFLMSAIANKKFISIAKERIFRLGVPLLFGLIFMCPLTLLLTYINEPTFMLSNKIIELPLICKNSLYAGSYFNIFWFLPILLIFNLITLLVFYHLPKISYKTLSSLNSPSKVISLITGLSAIYVSIVLLYFGNFHFWKLCGAITVLATPFFNVIIAFLLGLIAFNGKWLDKIPNKINTKQILFALILFLSLGFVWLIGYQYQIQNTIMFSIIYGFTFACTSTLASIFIIWICKVYLNHHSVLFSNIKQHSYGIFIVHIPIMLYTQYLMSLTNCNHIVKFLVVNIFTLTVSYFISKKLLTKIPILNDAMYGKKKFISKLSTT